MAALTLRRPRRAHAAFAIIETYEGLMADADLRARRGNFDQAAFLAARAALQPRPRSPRSDRFSAHLRAADLYRLASNYEAAEAHIRNASGVATSPADDARVASVLGAIHRDRGQVARGIRAVSMALHQVRTDPIAAAETNTALGQLLIVDSRRGEALDALKAGRETLSGTGTTAELTNLKWLIMAERPHRRFKPGWHSLRLAAQRRTWWRAAETAVILIGGRPLYRLLHPRRRQLER